MLLLCLIPNLIDSRHFCRTWVSKKVGGFRCNLCFCVHAASSTHSPCQGQIPTSFASCTYMPQTICMEHVKRKHAHAKHNLLSKPFCFCKIDFYGFHSMAPRCNWEKCRATFKLALLFHNILLAYKVNQYHGQYALFITAIRLLLCWVSMCCRLFHFQEQILDILLSDLILLNHICNR